MTSLDIAILFSTAFGLSAGLLCGHLLGAKWRAKIPEPASGMVIAIGMVIGFISLMASTGPSFARRIEVVGEAYDGTTYKVGRTTVFRFKLQTSSGTTLHLETLIAIPHWGNKYAFNGRMLHVIYLDDPDRVPKNEAVYIASKENEDWHEALDARPFGIWLGMPLAILVCAFGQYNKRSDEKPDPEWGSATSIKPR